MANVFFTADLHIGHARIIELAHRPFATVEAMNEALVANWNRVVTQPDDIVWVLGDYALGDRRAGLAYLSRLNGRKMLVSGNHDKCWVGHSDGWKHVAGYMAAGFEVVSPFARAKLPPLQSNDDEGRKVALSHFPYDGDHTDDERHIAFRLRDEGIPLVHGHVHQEYTVRRSSRGTPGVNVGVDRWDFTPVSAQTVARIFDDVEAGRRDTD